MWETRLHAPIVKLILNYINSDIKNKENPLILEVVKISFDENKCNFSRI